MTWWIDWKEFTDVIIMIGKIPSQLIDTNGHDYQGDEPGGALESMTLTVGETWTPETVKQYSQIQIIKNFFHGFPVKYWTSAYLIVRSIWEGVDAFST